MLTITSTHILLIFALLVSLWIIIGSILVLLTASRGLFADLLFILTWPIHLIRFFKGKE